MMNTQLVLLLLPLVILQYGLMIFCLVDLFRQERQVRHLGKPLWALVIVLGQLLGSIVYLVLGREES